MCMVASKDGDEKERKCMKNIIRCRGGKFVWENGERKRGSKKKSALKLDIYGPNH